jgi:hypothetical protein
MRKVLLLLVGTAVLWVPAVSIAGDTSKPAARTEKVVLKSDASNPASTCKSQRDDSKFGSSHDGQTFTRFYGKNGGKGHGVGRNAFGKCVSTIAMSKAEGSGKKSAESRDKDSADGHGKDKAEGRDMDSAESDREDSTESNDKGTTNPAMTCKAMQANDPAHFQTTYGARPNAFGKCVSSRANSKKG